MLMSQEFENKSQFFSYAQDAYAEKVSPSLHCFQILPKSISLQELEQICSRRKLNCNLRQSGEDIFVLGIGIRTSYQVGILIPYADCWIFFCEGDVSKAKPIVAAFVRNMSPFLGLAYLPSGHLLDFIEEISEAHTEIVVNEGTLCTEGETHRKWKKRPIPFSKEIMLEEAKRENAKWTGITLTYCHNGGDVARIRLHEKGQLTLYHGDFLDFYERFLMAYTAKSLDFQSLFEERERRIENGEVKIFPLKFQFEEDLTSGQLETMKGKILSKFIGAVVHPGNPMLMMEFSDPRDGSLYDLYVCGNVVEIVPLDKVSSTSFGELTAFISDMLPMGVPLEW